MERFFNKNLKALDYRIKAKEYCQKQDSKLTSIFAIYFVITVVVLVLDSVTGKTTVYPDGTVVKETWFQSIFTLITGGAFALSLAEISKKVYLDIELKTEDLFHGFKEFGRSISVYLLQSLYIALWSLLLIVPGIIKACSYSMTMCIANDNKELSAKECIAKSTEMMDGHKWEYFCLVCSYIGWLLLCVLTFGILSIWVLPKMQQAIYLFYLKVSGIGERIEDELENGSSETIEEPTFSSNPWNE